MGRGRREDDDDDESMEETPEATQDTKQEDEETVDATQSIRNEKDPDEARRMLREEMRKMVAKGEEQSNDINNTTIESMEADLTKMDKLFKEVKDTREASLDSKWLMRASDIAATKAKLMKHDPGGFDVDDFVANLVSFMGGGDDEEDSENEGGAAVRDHIPLEWHKIGRKALAHSRRVPTISFMLGPLSAEVKKRVVKERAKLDKNETEAMEAEELTTKDVQNDENETTSNVTAIEKLLEQQGPVNVLKFVVNPHDFAESVENVFYLSFLIRDGKCALEWSEAEEGKPSEPVVYVTEAPTEEDYEAELRKNQLVLEFDMATWKRAIDVFNITEPLIPTRPKVNGAGPKRKWP